MVRSEGRKSRDLEGDMYKDWVLRFIRDRVLAVDKLRLLEQMMSLMNFLQSTHTSMVLQPSVISFGNSTSSREVVYSPCLDGLEKLRQVRTKLSIIFTPTNLIFSSRRSRQPACFYSSDITNISSSALEAPHHEMYKYKMGSWDMSKNRFYMFKKCYKGLYILLLLLSD